MNIAIKILSSMLVAVVLSSAHASGQTTEKANANRQIKNDSTKPGPAPSAKETPVPVRKPNPPAEQHEKEEKQWGLQVVTGEKWYQVSIKLVM